MTVANDNTRIRAPDKDGGPHFSFPLGIPLAVDPALLLGMHALRGTLWCWLLHAVYLSLLGAFVWMAASGAQYHRTRDPSLTRLTWVLNWLLFFVTVPWAAYVIFGIPSLVTRLDALGAGR